MIADNRAVYNICDIQLIRTLSSLRVLYYKIFLNAKNKSNKFDLCKNKKVKF